MRKITALLLVCLLVFSVFPAFAEDTVTPRVAALSGPTAMGMAAFLTADSVYAAADELVPLFSRGEIDIASVPLNLIANLYNNPDMKDENRPLLLAVNTLGVLSQHDPYAVPKQDLCPTQYGFPASIESYSITMIRKNSLFIKLFLIKTSSKSIYEQFMPLVKPESETCPFCGSSGNLHVHCYYNRHLIDFNGKNTVRHDVTVLRCTCDSCSSTHAILPDIIIPYCSYSLFFVLRVLGEYFMHLYTVEKLCERFSITPRQLYKWLFLWKKHKTEWLGFLASLEVPDKGFIFSLSHMECFSDFTSGFVRTFGFSFLQSHANPKNAVYCRNIFIPDYIFSPTT